MSKLEADQTIFDWRLSIVDCELPERCDVGLRVRIQRQLMRIGAPIRADRDRFTTPYQRRAALSEPLPSALRVLGRPSARRPVPAFHRLNRESVLQLATQDLDRLRERRFGCCQNRIV